MNIVSHTVDVSEEFSGPSSVWWCFTEMLVLIHEAVGYERKRAIFDENFVQSTNTKNVGSPKRKCFWSNYFSARYVGQCIINMGNTIVLSDDNSGQAFLHMSDTLVPKGYWPRRIQSDLFSYGDILTYCLPLFWTKSCLLSTWNEFTLESNI